MAINGQLLPADNASGPNLPTILCGRAMGIRFLCPNGHKLNVKADLAGKRGSCPECGAKLVIPAATTTAETAQPTAPLSLPGSSPAQATIMAAPAAVTWHFRTANGEQHGPLSELQLRATITAGRVSADTLVWQEGWPEWRPARAVAELLPAPLLATAAAAPMAQPLLEPLASPVLHPTTIETSAAQTTPAAYDLTSAHKSIAAGVVDDQNSVVADEDSAADPAALATSKYVYQRRKNKQKQITLAVAMLVAVLILATVLYFVISLNSGATTDALAAGATPPSSGSAQP